jgi:hypothetical protein
MSGVFPPGGPSYRNVHNSLICCRIFISERFQSRAVSLKTPIAQKDYTTLYSGSVVQAGKGQ